MKNILIIDSRASSRERLVDIFKSKKVKLFAFDSPVGALKLFNAYCFDLIFSDGRGIEVLDRHKRKKELPPLIHLSNLQEQANKNAAAHLKTPIDKEAVLNLFDTYTNHTKSPDVIAESSQMRDVFSQIKKVAATDSNVFIVGESGTGKEVVASTLQKLSKRSLSPFIKVNCASLSETLIESEFFGHEKGAYTGAHATKIGRFERADGGTLLLDEVSEISPALQAKLLRVIQEKEVERVGGSSPISIDVRLIATSNQNMIKALENKTFRQDLYYRLNVIPIFLPPLRERREDIIPLAELFLNRISEKNQIEEKTLSSCAKKRLLEWQWPGNIRELQNVIEHSVALYSGPILKKEHLFLGKSPSLSVEFDLGGVQRLDLAYWEKQLILEALKRYSNHRQKAAEALGMSVKTLRNKLYLYSKEI